MRWLRLTLLTALCVAGLAGQVASSQEMRGPPPPPPGPGGMPPPPPDGRPPLPPPGDPNDPQRMHPPLPPPYPLQQPQPLQRPQQPQPVQPPPSQPGWPTQNQTPQPPPPAATSPAMPVAAPAAAEGSPAADAEPAPIPHATVDPEAAKWATDSVKPASPTAAPRAADKPASEAPMEHYVEMVPRWVWIVVVAVPVMLLLLSFAIRRMVGLEVEKARLARRQRQLEIEQLKLRGQSEQLRHQATNDPLTGILNRRAFADEMRKLLEQLAGFSRPVDLIVFDLDHFKQINDQQGHLAGDIALKLVAGIVHKHLRSDDLFGRFGGDEFLIACADRAPEATEQLADTIRRAVVAESANCKPPLPGLSLSMGIARANRETGYHIEPLFARADTALYAAKRGGRNRVVVASDDLPRPPAAETVTRQLA